MTKLTKIYDKHLSPGKGGMYNKKFSCDGYLVDIVCADDKPEDCFQITVTSRTAWLPNLVYSDSRKTFLMDFSNVYLNDSDTVMINKLIHFLSSELSEFLQDLRETVKKEVNLEL